MGKRADIDVVATTASQPSIRAFVPAGIPVRPVWTTLTLRPTASSRQVRHVVEDGAGRALAAEEVSTSAPSLWRVGAHAAATFAVVVIIGMVCLATLPALFGYRPVVVTSGSMEPSIRTADVVITAATDGNDLKVGMVIDHDAGDAPTLHRIADVTDAGYRTAGDANRVVDSVLVQAEQVRGIGLVVVPFVGHPYEWFHSNQWLLLLLATGGFVLAVHVARPSWLRRARRW